MRDEALFLNGVFEDVLADILAIQGHLPEQVLYLQPYKSERMVHLHDRPPSIRDPMRLLASVTDDLATVHYVGEIVGWDDKRRLHGPRRDVVEKVIRCLQPTEGGVYEYAKDPSKLCVNLLHVWRLQKLSRPFSVAKLTVRSTGKPHSINRSRSGGWSYVVDPGDVWLQNYL